MEHLDSDRSLRRCLPAGRLALVVEREGASRQLTTQFLCELGFHVELAADGASGLEKARQLRPALVVSEILLGQLDGFALCRRVKGSAPETRVVLLSVLSAAARARDAGADVFLSKPLSQTKLAAALAGLLPAQLQEHG
jgi:CheY-like chemotaxis protein